MPGRLCVLLLLAACSGERSRDNPDDPPPPAALVGAADGHYVVAFHREGGAFAIGRFTVQDNLVTGSAAAPDGSEVLADGHVATDGTLVLDRLVDGADRGIEFLGGRAGDGVLEGTYAVGEATGHFAGTLQEKLLHETPNREFDGSYEVALYRDEVEVSASVLVVRRGHFRTSFTSQDDYIVDVQGFVTSDGTLALTSDEQVDGWPVMAEAAIDQDSFAIEGVYRFGERVGQVIGRRSD